MQQFKDSHHAFFVAILAKFLDSIMPHDEKSAFSGPVAYKLLSTAVDEARGTKVQFKIPILTTLVDWYKPTVTKERGIKTSQDLLLLLEVYTSQRKHTEALKILDDEWYSDNASFGRRDWEFARHKLELLDLAGFRTRQWEFCTMLLNDALPDDLRDPPQFRAFEYGKAGDDWLVWKGLLSAFAASDQTKKEARRSRAEELINSFEQLPDPRNAKLAAVALLEPRTDGFFERLCSFIRIFCAKQTCFRDIRPYIEQIRQDQQWPLLQYVAQCAKDLQPSGDSNVGTKTHVPRQLLYLSLHNSRQKLTTIFRLVSTSG